MKSPIFISYKRADKDKVFKIKDFIKEDTGLSCWIDLEGIESDAYFKSVIIKAIRECEVMLFMYSKAHSQIRDPENDWTMKELNFASKKGKRIVFIKIDGTELTDEFEFDYGAKQQVDAGDPSRLQKLADDLKIWLKSYRQVPAESEGTTTALEGTATPDFSETTVSVKLPNSLSFILGKKKFCMVLSPDRRYYLGNLENLESTDTDLSWWDNPVIKTIGAGTLSAVAPMAGLLALPFFVNGFKKLAFLMKPVVNRKVCDAFSRASGMKFEIPTEEELEGVAPEKRDGYIVVRVKDNPQIFQQAKKT